MGGGGGCQGRPSRGRSGTEPTQGGSADLEGRREGHGEPQDRDWGEAAVPSPHPPPPRPCTCATVRAEAQTIPQRKAAPWRANSTSCRTDTAIFRPRFPPPPPPPARPPPPHPTPHGAGLRRGPIAAAPSSRRCHRHRVCRGGWWSHSALWLSHPPPPPTPKEQILSPACLELVASLPPSFPPSIHQSHPPPAAGEGRHKETGRMHPGGGGLCPGTGMPSAPIQKGFHLDGHDPPTCSIPSWLRSAA